MTRGKSESIEHYRERRRMYYAKNREHIRELCRSYQSKNTARKRRYYAEHRDECRRKAREYEHQHRDKCLRAYARRRAKVRLAVFSHYGLKCACCGESEYDFLSIDHINGGGRKHIREIGTTATLYDWLIDNNFPEGFQTLCFNCNLAKGLRGSCPHTRKVQNEKTGTENGNPGS